MMLSTRLYLAQRITALLMPFVALHLGLIIYAVRDGLSAAEILGRTNGSTFWLLFYGLFVVTVSIHGAIGLRVVINETFGLKGLGLRLFTWGAGTGLFLCGAFAVYAVTFP
jgi:fumarate reductase subunit C